MAVDPWTDAVSKAYDRWRTEPPELKDRGAMVKVYNKRGKWKLKYVNEDDIEIMNADDRFDAEKHGDY